MNTEECPLCGADLRGEPIPVESRHFYGPGSTHYSRTIGIGVRGAYDGVLYWLCPDCGGTWNRWSPDHPRHALAEHHMAASAAPNGGDET